MPSLDRQRGFLYQRFFTLKQQSGVGVVTGLPAGCDRSVALKGYSPAKLALGRSAPADAFAAGREWPDRTDDGKREVEISDTYDLTPLTAGYLAGFAFGQAATSGAEAPYTHVFTVQTGIDLPVTAVIDQMPGGKVMFPDLCLADWSVSGSGTSEQILQSKATWKGSGRFDDDSATFSGYTAPALSRSAYLRMGGLSFQIGEYGSEAETGAKIERFEYRFANNPFDGHRPGTGLEAGYAEAGARRAHTFTFEALRDSSDTLLGWYKDKTRLSLILTVKADDWASSGQQIEIRIPQLEIVKCDPTGGDSQSVSVETAVLFDPDGAGYDAANPSGVKITVKNAEPAHLAELA